MAGETNKIMPQGNLVYGLAGDGNAYPFPINKTIQTELLTATTIAASTQTKSSVVSLTGATKVIFYIDHGRASTAAFGTQGTEYRVETSQKASGNDAWVVAATVTCASTVCLAIASSAAGTVAQTSIVITSGTAPTLGDLVSVANTATPANTEWLKVASVTGTASFTILDGLTYAYAAADTIFTQAERRTIAIDNAAYSRARIVINNNNSGTTQAIRSRIACITAP